MINTAIIGAGIISDSHIEGWQKTEGAKLVAIVDADPERAKQKAKKWNIPSVHTDYRDILKDPDINAVDICLPHSLHAKVTIECLKAEKHVLCEKPIALTVEDALRVIEEEKKHDKILMIAENWYFIPVISEALRLYKEGLIGKIYGIRGTLDFPGLRSWPKEKTNIRGEGWRGDRKSAGGGILMDAGIHSLSVARLFLGEAETVWGIEGKQLWKHETGLEDTFSSIMRFRGGAIATFNFTESAGWNVPKFDFTFLGEKGVIEADLISQNMTIHTEKDSEVINKPAKGGMTEEIEHFADCIRNNKVPLSNSEDQLKTLKLLLSAYISADSGGMPVNINKEKVEL